MPGSDPMSPTSSRFPLSPPQGVVVPSDAAPSGSSTRPFGMGFAIVPATVNARHGKKPTRVTVKFQTAIYSDGQISGYKPDEEVRTQMDEE